METVTTRELTCIGCPMGCPLTVTMEAGEVISVTGNTCKRGDIYARKEVTNPTRIVTSTVRVTGGDADMVSVKTKEDIPKGYRHRCISEMYYWKMSQVRVWILLQRRMLEQRVSY